MTLVRRILLALILATSLSLMIGSSLQESAVMDELAHIPAGYGYVKYFDYRLNPEHPPLVKMLAGVPLLFLNLNFPVDNPAWRTAVNGQWDMGTAFLYQSGNDPDQVIQLARAGPMLLTMILILFVYMWSRELMGGWWALLPTAATALSPHFLAHGHYVTTDTGAALGIIVSLYYFNRYLMTPDKRHLVVAGIAFGFAQLMKFSAALLVVHFILMIVLYAIAKRQGGVFKSLTTRLGKLFLMFAIGALTIYPLYQLTVLNYPPAKQLSDTEIILAGVAPSPPPGGSCSPVRCLVETIIWSSDKPIIRSYSQYLLGLAMVFQRSAGGNMLYFLGHVSNSGGWLYFPTVYALKETLPMLILVLLATIFALWEIMRSSLRRHFRFRDYLATNLHEFSMMAFIILYAGYSIHSSLNIGLRHLMPIIPLIYILSVNTLKQVAYTNFQRRQLKTGLVILLVLWHAGIAFAAYPHYLSYFNNFVGTTNGWRYVTDSNYDWGQDLKRLVTVVEEQGIEKIAIDYFGAGSPAYYMSDQVVFWNSRMGSPTESGIEWLAISVNQLQNAMAPTAVGFNRDIESEYRWLKTPYEPDLVAGNTIFIYHLEPTY